MTRDGGFSWQPHAWAGEPAAPPPGLGIFGPQHHILAVDTPDAAEAGGTLTFYAPARTGPSWRPVGRAPTRLAASAVAVLSGSDWVVIANPYLLATTDAGRRWTRVLTTPRIYGSDLAMADGQHGWILQPAACPSFSCPSELLATSDVGRAWTPLNPP